MLLKPSDVGSGFVTQPSSGDDPHVDCPRSVSEADLTQTGDVEGPQMVRGNVSVGSSAQVYESVADASASWRRANSAAGIRCATNLLRREFAKSGFRLVSLSKIAFPRVSERSVAYRARLTFTTAQGEVVSLTIDLVVLMRSRALAQVIVGAALTLPDRAEEIRLARLVAGRMARAMRGA